MNSIKEGQYFYAPHRRSWGVFKAGKTVNGTRMDDFIQDFSTKVQAERFVYKANKWIVNTEEEDNGRKEGNN